MRLWRIVYSTRDAMNRPRQVTGVVVALPDRKAGNQRVIAWNHGTTGVVERCAPSLYPDFTKITPALSEMVGRGYVVVAPDYPGLGSVRCPAAIMRTVRATAVQRRLTGSTRVLPESPSRMTASGLSAGR
jgi:acetyl esterase/lipase